MAWNIQEMRKQLQNNTKYKYSEKWYNRVEHMPDNQVIAVYMRMKSAGQISV